MRKYEKKSFITTLFLFLVPLILFSSMVLFMYYKDKMNDIEQNLLYQMKDYTFDFHGDKFSLDIVEDDKQKDVFKIYHCNEGLCAYFKIQSTTPYLLKVIFNKEKYEKVREEFLVKLFQLALVTFVFLFLFSIGFTIYSLRPMRQALYLLQNFLKDLIHDLNTPATSILLNSKLLRRHGNFDEIGRIELSAQIIASLYKNLELITPNQIVKDEEVSLEKLIDDRIELLNKIYPKINFEKNVKNFVIQSNKNAIERIIDNLLTNACKYNKKNGIVRIIINKPQLIIEDTGIGIKDTQKVFQRYYKENESGLGLGMNIVKQLCDILHIDIEIKSEIGKGTKIILKFD